LQYYRFHYISATNKLPLTLPLLFYYPLIDPSRLITILSVSVLLLKPYYHVRLITFFFYHVTAYWSQNVTELAIYFFQNNILHSLIRVLHLTQQLSQHYRPYNIIATAPETLPPMQHYRPYNISALATLQPMQHCSPYNITALATLPPMQHYSPYNITAHATLPPMQRYRPCNITAHATLPPMQHYHLSNITTRAPYRSCCITTPGIQLIYLNVCWTIY
jgi:hypothetical protein